MHQRRVADLLGAHVSTQGGVHHALARGKAIGATAIQVFTKTPNQWREPALSEESRTAFRRECDRSEIARIVAHDSYLINLATPDPVLLGPLGRVVQRRASALRRCSASRRWCRIPATLSTIARPASDGTPPRSPAVSRRFPATVMVLLETTAGSGTSLGSHVRGAGRAPGVGRRRACAIASPSAPTPVTSMPRVTTWWATTTACGGAGSRPSASGCSAASTSTTPRRRSARAATATS